MEQEKKSLIQIHIAVLLFGMPGLFGKELPLSPMTIVFGRVLFSSLFLFLFTRITKRSLRLESIRLYAIFGGLGLLLAVHWTAFYQAIQLSTVAIGLLSVATFPVFVTFLEPLFFRERLRLNNVISAGITFGGILLMIPRFNWGDRYTQGLLWGVLSGFIYAVLAVMHRRYTQSHSGTVIAFYEQVSAGIVLLPFAFMESQPLSGRSLFLLVLLGVAFTGIAHTLFIEGLRNIRAQAAGIISNLEPVYGILFAALLLGEIPSFREVLGGLIILGAACYASLSQKGRAIKSE